MKSSDACLNIVIVLLAGLSGFFVFVVVGVVEVHAMFELRTRR